MINIPNCLFSSNLIGCLGNSQRGISSSRYTDAVAHTNRAYLEKYDTRQQPWLDTATRIDGLIGNEIFVWWDTCSFMPASVLFAVGGTIGPIGSDNPALKMLWLKMNGSFLTVASVWQARERDHIQGRELDICPLWSLNECCREKRRTEEEFGEGFSASHSKSSRWKQPFILLQSPPPTPPTPHLPALGLFGMSESC